MDKVVGRPMTEVEAEMLKDYYSAITTNAVEMTHFGTKKTEKSDFISDFIAGAKDLAVEALKNGKEPDLYVVMKEHMSSLYGKKENDAIYLRRVVTLTDDQKKALKEMEKVKKDIDSLRAEAQKQMDRMTEIDKELEAEDLSEEKKAELEGEKSDLTQSLESNKGELDKQMGELDELTEKTNPTKEQLQNALHIMVKKLPKDQQTEIQKELKEFGEDSRLIKKILELSKTEATDKYIEMIENSKMSPEEKKEAIERTKNPNFDPHGAIAGMMSESDDIEDEI